MLSNVSRRLLSRNVRGRPVPSPSNLFPSSLTQWRSMFIQTEATPNPESLKFVVGRSLPTEKEGQTLNFYATKNDKDEIARSPLAKVLFDVDGVKGVYLGEDFISVTKRAEAQWDHVQTEVFGVIMDFFDSGKPALMNAPEITDTTILDDDDEIVAMIKELLETRIRPAVQEDGGDIKYVGFDFETGIVSVRLEGSCAGCPSSSVTLKNGVENMLMHYIPEVTMVSAIDEVEDGDEGGDGSGTDMVEKTKATSYEDRLKAAGIPFSE